MIAFKPGCYVSILCLVSIQQLAAEWYKGNTHVHTELCGHADSSPEAVTRWYHDRGYNFLILSEHNIFIDPLEVKMPANRRDDFILVPGEEVTGKFKVHTTAMNIERLVSWKDDEVEETHQVIQNHVDRIHQAHGHTILNHPHGGSQLDAQDILPVEGLHMMEVFNASTRTNNIYKREGMGLPLTAEGLWDELLTRGFRVYGVGSDDAHKFKSIGPNQSNAGMGWVMVQSEALTPEAVSHAMVQGHFYASNGVHLKTCSAEAGLYQVEVDEQQTAIELTGLPAWAGIKVPDGPEGYRIEFIGAFGDVLESVSDLKATFTLPSGQAYMRVRVSYTRETEGGFEAFYAWGQPLFSTSR